MSGQRRIAWLASYPRSGNSWVNVLLANFLSASTEPVGINEIPEGVSRHRGLPTAMA